MSDTEDPERGGGGGGSGWSLCFSTKAYGMQMDIGSVCHRGWWIGTMTMYPCSSLPLVLVPLKCGILVNPAETAGWAGSIRTCVEECIAWSQVPFDRDRPEPAFKRVCFLDSGFTRAWTGSARPREARLGGMIVRLTRFLAPPPRPG